MKVFWSLANGTAALIWIIYFWGFVILDKRPDDFTITLALLNSSLFFGLNIAVMHLNDKKKKRD